VERIFFKKVEENEIKIIETKVVYDIERNTNRLIDRRRSSEVKVPEGNSVSLEMYGSKKVLELHETCRSVKKHFSTM
jgi:hypothetical protein